MKKSKLVTRMRSFLTQSPFETHALAESLAPHLKIGDVLLLMSNLGGGKTTFSQGLLKSLGVKDAVLSPTFVLAQTFQGRFPIHHLDFYRTQPRELLKLGIQDYFMGEGEIEKGLVVVEWAERCRSFWPPEYLEIQIRIVKGQGQRQFRIRSVGERMAKILEEL